MTFSIALSGLNAASTDLSVTGNNIANVATTGFKYSQANFADVFAAGSDGVGNGVSVASIDQQFQQGTINTTNNPMDVAISGQGFFTLSDNGSLVYTRAGSFGVDANGYVVNSAKQRLQVFPPTGNGGFNTGALNDLQLTQTDSSPQATANATVTLNLPASAAAPTTTPFSPTDATSYTQSTSMSVYDSLGNAHTATYYFVKGTTANTWDLYTYIDGNAVGGANALTYSSAGALTSPTNGQIALSAYDPGNGAAQMNVTLNLGQSTQYGSSFAVNAMTQDGYASGQLSSVDIDQQGVVYARFTNGRSTALGQVALSNFPNAQGLQQLGNTSWAETFASGQAIHGQAGTASFGLLQSGALESSNVDLTAQLVNMINAQRNFQANAQAISTEDNAMQSIINIR